jgi:23S rRNA pseudouridine1911/1915/1917 synthase
VARRRRSATAAPPPSAAPSGESNAASNQPPGAASERARAGEAPRLDTEDDTKDDTRDERTGAPAEDRSGAPPPGLGAPAEPDPRAAAAELVDDTELADDAELGAGDDDAAEGSSHVLRVAAEDADSRLDVYLAAQLDAPRTLVQRLIEAQLVTVAGLPAKKAGQRLRAGDAIVAVVPRPRPLEAVAEDLPLPILYQDAQLVVVDKPAGMVVHPAAGHSHGTMVNALLFHCRDLSGIGGVLRPGIVHRLDKDTSGVMVVSKDDLTHSALAAEFAHKSAGGVSSLRREYLAISSPAPPQDRGTYRTLYGRHPIHRQRFSSKVTRGKSAVTHWEVLERFAGAALVSFRLETGRTHQIRVHAADHGWPLVGDLVYGHRPADPRLAELAAQLRRQALHAHLLAFAHPRSGAPLSFTSPLPADLSHVLEVLRARESLPPSLPPRRP